MSEKLTIEKSVVDSGFKSHEKDPLAEKIAEARELLRLIRELNANIDSLDAYRKLEEYAARLSELLSEIPDGVREDNDLPRGQIYAPQQAANDSTYSLAA